MRFLFLFFVMITFAAGEVLSEDPQDALRVDAQRLAKEIIIVDAHVDTPYRLWDEFEDISQQTEKGNFDYPRARSGGLNAPFMAIYTSPKTEKDGTARALADSLINMVEGWPVKWPSKFEIVTTPDGVESAARDNKVALLLGMENGAPLAGDIKNVEYFYNRGVRYITLAHAENNHICDSSFDKEKTWSGLSPFGRAVVREMNRLGMIIDVSHISDDAFYQVVELSTAPVIATHSGCRSFTPGWERNIADDMIEMLADKGGMININFGSIFVNDECRRRFSMARQQVERIVKEKDLDPDDPKVREIWRDYLKNHPIGFADITDVANHIDHVVDLVGVDYVGLGSDFDGLGDSLPTGLKDVSAYPNLIYELLKRGYTEDDIKKIASGNMFRVMNEVDRVARESKREEG
ncbi:MAG: dipeptidase [Candidatus Latescibacterota bacterium]|nr:MAG: dipeptidase [Candidatus Latescibacterota bacterium]